MERNVEKRKENKEIKYTVMNSELQKIIYNFSKQNKVQEILSLQDSTLVLVENKTKKNLLEQMEKSLIESNFFASVNYIFLNLVIDTKKTIEILKSKGLLRYSKYIKGKCHISSYVKEILTYKTNLQLTAEDIQYFESLNSLEPLYKILKEKSNDILKGINFFKKYYGKKNESLTKSLLVFLEVLFLRNYMYQPSGDGNSLNSYSKEEIAEGIAYIIYIISTQYKKDELLYINENYINSDEIQELILNACHFKDIQEIEISIEYFPFIADLENNIISVKSTYLDFEKSVRLGYVRNELHKIYDAKNSYEEYKHIPSIAEITDIMLKSNVNFCYLKQDDGYERYIIAIPDPIVDYLKEQFFKGEELFRDEVMYLEHIMKEQNITPDFMRMTKIKNELTLYEFMKIKRMFIVLLNIFEKKIVELTKGNELLLYKSLIPTFDKTILYNLLEKISTRNNIDTFIEIMAWDFEKRSYLDLQYQPFIKIGERYICIMSTFVESNTLRNLFSLEYKNQNANLLNDGSFDPISYGLTQAFSTKDFKTFQRIKHNYKQGGNIDFLAYKDDILLIAECKNLLTPTSIYEQRTTFNEVKKAASQLNLILEGLKTESFRQQLTNKIGINVNHFKNIKTVIVINGRVFCGTKYFGHPIRNINEFGNFVEKGTFYRETGVFSTWINEKFSNIDLINFLNDEWKFNEYFFSCLTETPTKYNFNKLKIIVENYTFDSNLAVKNFEKTGFRQI